MDRLRIWFESLAQRERLLVLLASALAMMAVVVIGVLQPLASTRNALVDELTAKRSVLDDIERVAARFGQSGGAAATADQTTAESLVVLIDRTTRSRGLAAHLRRNEPDGANGIRLRFENVPFDDLVLWLGDLQALHGIAVTNASADPTDNPGRVSANLQLSRTSPR